MFSTLLNQLTGTQQERDQDQAKRDSDRVMRAKRDLDGDAQQERDQDQAKRDSDRVMREKRDLDGDAQQDRGQEVEIPQEVRPVPVEIVREEPEPEVEIPFPPPPPVPPQCLLQSDSSSESEEFGSTPPPLEDIPEEPLGPLTEGFDPVLIHNYPRRDGARPVDECILQRLEIVEVEMLSSSEEEEEVVRPDEPVERFINEEPAKEPEALTENAARSYATVYDARVEFFFKAVRGLKDDHLRIRLENSWAEDPLDTLRIIFQARDCRGGKGERQLFFGLYGLVVDQVATKCVGQYGVDPGVWSLVGSGADSGKYPDRRGCLGFIGSTIESRSRVDDARSSN